MYRPPAFDVADLQELHALIEASGPAHLVTANLVDGRQHLVSSILPMLFDASAGEHGVLTGHLARPNAQWRDLVDGIDALAIFPGPDAYVSPSFYATKRDTGKVVPTWNYTVLNVSGRLIVHDDPEWTRAVVTGLTERHEGRRAEPWSVTDTPASYIDTMLRGIVGLELVVTAIEGKRKLSQNKSDADVDGVIAGLREGSAPERAVAEAIRAAALR